MATGHATGTQDQRVAAKRGYDIYIVGLGILSYLQVTREVEQALRLCKKVFYLHPEDALVGRYLNTLGPTVVNIYGNYEEAVPRNKAYEGMIETVLEAAKATPPVSLALYGHPLVFVTPTKVICERAPKLGLSVKVLPGISALDCIFVDLGLDPCAGLVMYEANDLLLRRYPLLPDVPCLIWQPGTVESELFTLRQNKPARFLRLKRYLLECYPPDHEVTIITCATNPAVDAKITKVALGDIETQHVRLHQGTTLYIPPSRPREDADLELYDLLTSREHLHTITHDKSPSIEQ